MKTALKNAPHVVQNQPSDQLCSDHRLMLNVTYHGKHKDRRQRLKINGQRVLSTAAMYELYAQAGAEGFARRHISTTPGYQAGLPGERHLIAICPKTQKQFLVIGTVEYLVPKSEETSTGMAVVDTASNSEDNESLTRSKDTSVTNTVPMVVDDDDKKHVREQRKLKAFIRELGFIKAQCDAGFDPPISIPATGYISNRSVATTYRDIKKGILPKPNKIGRSSTFPYSIAKAYADGQLIGGAV